jgi:hypothetical protein
MRVAGVVLWTAEPVATAAISKSGGGQGSSVSFAYALSSGRVESVARIWADGRLIRDGGGRQEIALTLRLHNGDEDQLSDSLIASILGEDRAPAFRGIAYLMFENFDLSTFGNRIPLITVEVTGGGKLITAENIIMDSLGLVGSVKAEVHHLVGYALTGDDKATALAPLCEAFAPSFSYATTGWTLAPTSVHHSIDEPLWVFDHQEQSVFDGATGALPTKVSVRFFDPDIDFAGGEQSARQPGVERLKRLELPAALTSDRAKAVAFERLRYATADLEQRWLKLPLSYSNIRLGDQVSCATAPAKR